MNPIFPELPSKLGIYTLTEMIGAREYSELYLATQSYVDRSVVIEVLRPEQPGEVAAWFRESAKNRAGVNLPRVSPVLESAQSGNICYLIQEMPRGEQLSRRVSEGKLLTVAQGFALVQAEAELYEACRVHNLAALPLGADSIYWDGGAYSFLSPLSTEMADAVNRAEQMEGLAAVLEGTIDEGKLQNSKLSAVIHWLRHGYGGRPLEWAPLISALRTLKTRKNAENGRNAVETERKKSILRFGKKRYLRRAWRVVEELGFRFLICSALVILLGLCGLLIPSSRVSDDLAPAVTDDEVYVEEEGGVTCRVQARPVSVEQYAAFMKEWEGSDEEKRAALLTGLPGEGEPFDPTPLNWEQQVAQEEAATKEGKVVPVSGVSYRDAAVYARSKGEEVASAGHVMTARKGAPQAATTEEWTSSQVEKKLPYEAHYVVCAGAGELCVQAGAPEQKAPGRTFRTIKRN